MAVSHSLRCCAVTASAAEGDLRLPSPRLARSGQDRVKGPFLLPCGQGRGEPAPWRRHALVLARGHAAQGESRCVPQTGIYVTRVIVIARPVSDAVGGHHQSRYFPLKTGDPTWSQAPPLLGSRGLSCRVLPCCYVASYQRKEHRRSSDGGERRKLRRLAPTKVDSGVAAGQHPAELGALRKDAASR